MRKTITINNENRRLSLASAFVTFAVISESYPVVLVSRDDEGAISAHILRAFFQILWTSTDCSYATDKRI
jgi:hypothetical protein